MRWPAGDGSRASGRQHQVHDSHADGSLSLLGSEAARSHPWSDQSLKTTHRRFDQCALAVAGGSLPGQSAPFHDHRQMAITLCRAPGSALGTAVDRGGITTSMPSPCAAIVW
jgi:hypothetical protein